MSREEIEAMIAASLGMQSTYSPYGNNLQGGTVLYRDGKRVLKITYKAGTPTPWVLNKDGIAQHHPPMDETVLNHEIFIAEP